MIRDSLSNGYILRILTFLDWDLTFRNIGLIGRSSVDIDILYEILERLHVVECFDVIDYHLKKGDNLRLYNFQVVSMKSSKFF